MNMMVLTGRDNPELSSVVSSMLSKEPVSGEVDASVVSIQPQDEPTP